MFEKFVVKKTKTEEITCEVYASKKKIFLHSAYNPAKEAYKFIQNHMDQIKDKRKIIIYGLGCGYHIEALLQVISDIQKIEVWDFNVDFYNFISKEKQVANLLANKRLTFCITNDKQKILTNWAEFDNEKDYIILHSPSIEMIPPELDELKIILQMFHININNIRANKDILDKQFDENISKANLDKDGLLHNLLCNSSVVLVAAGPSLEKNIYHLKKNRDRIFIGAVGNALWPLISHDIIPDFFVLSDADPTLYKQFYQIDKRLQKIIPLFYLGTIAPKVVEMYSGAKIMLLQENFEKAEKLSTQFGIPLIKTGGSVATTLLDFSVYLGAKQVCFVGQDLAFTNNKTHVGGAMGCEEIMVDLINSNLLEIDDYFLRGKVYTPKNLYIYKNWIERYIEEHSEVEFFNVLKTIQGIHHIPL